MITLIIKGLRVLLKLYFEIYTLDRVHLNYKSLNYFGFQLELFRSATQAERNYGGEDLSSAARVRPNDSKLWRNTFKQTL